MQIAWPDASGIGRRHFCGKHNITAEVEMIATKEVNDAFKKVKKGEVRYRYVIDVAKTLTLE